MHVQRPRIFALLTLLSLACAGSRTTPAGTPAGCPELEPVYPAEQWERIEHARCAGWSSSGLDSVRARLATLSTTGFTAITRGRILMDYGDLERVSYLASVRKSVLSMLYGIYVERGNIALDRTLAQLGIDDVGGLTDPEKQATVRDLLRARSGVYHEASNGGDDLASAPPRGSQPPGTYYLYSNWDFNALGTIFEQETGRSIYDALESDLVRPIGMQDFERERHRRTGNASRSRHLAYHIHLSTRDMARIGYLMLREGNWHGTQVVPREWVQRSTRAITPVHEMNPTPRREGRFGYGYLWWVFDGNAGTGNYEGAYTGIGAGGQYITVIPKLDMVIAHKTNFQRTDRRVQHPRYFEMVDLVLAARCTATCPAAGSTPES